MSLDTPARMAILGAGPTGLEAALYARFLGYDCDVYERGRVAECLLQQGDQPLSVPWRLVASTLGLAALEAQNPDWQAPADDAVLTCAELVQRYFLPLAQSDLLAESVRTETTVLSVRREEMVREELHDGEDRTGSSFRILLLGSNGEQQEATADVVLDCTGRNQQCLEYDSSLGHVEALEALSGLLRAEPDFYILGEKSRPGGATLSFAQMQAQIRDLFAIIGDRPTLDLYATVRPLR